MRLVTFRAPGGSRPGVVVSIDEIDRVVDLAAPGDPVIIPAVADDVDYEGEVAVVISTGTPQKLPDGQGAHRPLRAGDSVTVRVSRLGELTTRFIAPQEAAA